jgi:GNAT superfamily N-acetyltransferase
MDFGLRDATIEDQAVILRALYAAWQWSHPWDERSFQRHLAAGSPDSYTDDFGRRTGDRGVIAEERVSSAPRFAGAAWYRFFTSADHRSGFVSDDIPEVAAAVEEPYRGHGLGRKLMTALIGRAAADGLSLRAWCS